MGLEELKPQRNRVIGIDCSSKSIAYGIFDDDLPAECGEVFFEGKDVYQRLNSARQVTQELVDKGILVGDYVAIESAVMVNNREIVIKLAYVLGAVLAVLMQNDMQVITVAPISWQSKIGVPNLTPTERKEIKEKYPDKSVTWLKAEGRRMRKQRIMDIAKTMFKMPTDSDNISDAIGLSFYANKELTRR